MNPEDTAILHPGSYTFRSTVATLVTRAVDTLDVAQRAALSNILTLLDVELVAGNTWQPAAMPQDTVGHFGRHLKWVSSKIAYRATEDADIKTDARAVIAAALLLL